MYCFVVVGLWFSWGVALDVARLVLGVIVTSTMLHHEVRQLQYDYQFLFEPSARTCSGSAGRASGLFRGRMKAKQLLT